VFPSVNVQRALPFVMLLCPFGAGRVVAAERLNLERLVEGGLAKRSDGGARKAGLTLFIGDTKNGLGFPKPFWKE
jgi:hypothetical protein